MKQLLMMFFVVTQLLATKYYVDPDGNNNNDGLSENNAFATIEKASSTIEGLRENAPDYTAKDTILLGNGTYTENKILLNAKTNLCIKSLNEVKDSVVLNASSDTLFYSTNDDNAQNTELFFEDITITNARKIYSGGITASTGRKYLRSTRITIRESGAVEASSDQSLFSRISTVDIDSSVITANSATLFSIVDEFQIKRDTIYNNYRLEINSGAVTTGSIYYSTLTHSPSNQADTLLNYVSKLTLYNSYISLESSLLAYSCDIFTCFDAEITSDTILFVRSLFSNGIQDSYFNSPLFLDEYGSGVAIVARNSRFYCERFLGLPLQPSFSSSVISFSQSTIELAGKDSLRVDSISISNSVLRNIGNTAYLNSNNVNVNSSTSIIDSVLVPYLTSTSTDNFYNVPLKYLADAPEKLLQAEYSFGLDVLGGTADIGCVRDILTMNSSVLYDKFSTDADLRVTYDATTHTVAENEVIVDTISFTNTSSTDYVYYPGKDSIITSGLGVDSLIEVTPGNTYIAPGETAKIAYHYTGTTASGNIYFAFTFRDYDNVDTYNIPDSVTISISYAGHTVADNLKKVWNADLVQIGKTVIDTFSLTNGGKNLLEIDRIKENSTDLESVMFESTGTSGPISIAAGDSAKVIVTYTGNVVGNVNEHILLDTKNVAGGVDSSITYTATVVDPLLSFDPTAVAFGSVYTDASSNQTVQIVNSKEYEIIVDSLVSSSTFFTITEVMRDTLVSSNSTLNFTVTFSPDSGIAYKDTITLYYASGKTTTIALTGTGVVDAVESLVDTVQFGNVTVGEELIKTFFIRNNGSATISITDALPYDSDFFVLDKASAIAPGDSGSFDVRYTASGSEGQESISIIKVKYLDGTGNAQTKDVNVKAASVLSPIAAIDSISHDTVKWSTETDVVFYATCKDLDVVGDQTVMYQWFCNGVLWDSVAVPSVKASTFTPDTYVFSVLVTDNEGDTARSAEDTLVVVGGAPIVTIDTITPRSVIIRDGETISFTFTAYDSDDNATNESDGLVSFGFYSTLVDTALATTKTGTIVPSSLEVGLHGFYAMAIDEEGDTAYSDTLEIPVQNSMGRAIIVTGHAFGETDYFFNNIAPNANIAYKRLRDRGYSNEQIYYMNPVSWQSIDGDPMSSSGIVDETAMTKENLQAHLASIAGDIKSDIPLVIYLLGHGSNTDQNNAKFYLNDSAYIDPTTLNTWLDDAFGEISGNKSYITIIADFCYSGGFVNGLKSSTQNRAVVTSADAGTPAYFSRGKSFATSIFNQVYRGQELKTCFESAQLWSEQNAPGGNNANPQIDCNGDGIVNSDEDLNIASTIYLGGAHNLQSPYSESDSVSVVVTDGVASVEALIKGEINSVSVRVVPVDGTLEDVDFGTLPLFDLTRDAQDTTKWVGEYSAFPANGEYLLLVEGVYGIDQAMLSIGKVVTVGETAIIVRDAPAKLFFNPAQYGGVTQLNFGLPVASDVRINIYDLRGRVVQQIVKTGLRAGYYSIPMSDLLGAGFYITQFSAGSANITSKMVVR